jgi:hypothetical protein
MITRCVLVHKWVGCKCVRCGVARDRDHAWNGCKCQRCGLVRDEEHDPQRFGCRLRCNRCGWDLGMRAHDWHGCLCQRCGANRHTWTEGVCQACGKVCGHNKQWFYRDDRDTSPAVGLCNLEVCEICGKYM